MNPMHRNFRSARSALGLSVLALGTVGLGTAGCQSAPTAPEKTSLSQTETSTTREIAHEPAVPVGTTAYGKLLKALALKDYRANLHAHHFMEVKGSKKNPLKMEDVLVEGPCRGSGTFTMDDGRPCRDVQGVVNATILPRKNEDGSFDLPDYFRQACAYATPFGTDEGDLDILFVTPHTKNDGKNEGQIVTSTSEAEMIKRANMLAEINPAQLGPRLGKPKHFCGLGQEASSISAGNHINILGQFKIGGTSPKPLFFPTGDFRALYAEVKTRRAAGEKIFLQLNHPGVKQDLWWKSMAEFANSKSRKKEGLNDYGLDDYAPVGCMVGKLTGPECEGVTATELTTELLKQTYVNIRKASGDPFRLIEVVPPGGSREGESTDEEGTTAPGAPKRFGATNNSMTTFPSVQDRKDPNTYEEGVFDWIYYLAMGFKIAPAANQDNHHANFGSATASRTGVLAKDLKEKSVLDAFLGRRTFASEDRNAGILLTLDSGKTKKVMGDIVKTSSRRGKFRVGYYDPDAKEASAQVRVYYYRANDLLDFTYGAGMKKVFRTLSFDARGRPKVPAIDATDRSENDLLPIRNGESVTIDLPLVRGEQWVFVEVIQDGDLDKVWSAPIWVIRR